LADLAGNKLLTKNLFQQLFKVKTFTPSSKNILLFFTTLLLDDTKTKHRPLPAIIWNFYYDATKLLQADNCIIITSYQMAW